ncbi:MAG TPA: glycosyltransferase, partial [Actinomycetota bacterium]
MRSPAVAFDVTPLAGFRTGIGLAVQETHDALVDAGAELVPYAIGLRVRTDGLPGGTRVVRLPTRGLVAAWGRAGRPRIDRWVRGARVVHATNYLTPPSRLPTLVTIHDCAFALFPETVTRVVLGFARVLRRAVARGAWVHCATEAIAEEVEGLFGPGLRREGRIAVVPFGVPRLDASEPLAGELQERLRGRPYLLALGTIEPRKNLARLVRAFGRMAGEHPDLRLVVAGPDGPGRPEVDDAIAGLDPDARGRVVLAGAVGPGQRRTLIGEAAVLAYPSIYEGFGFPMLEAMTLGVPVVGGAAGA